MKHHHGRPFTVIGRNEAPLAKTSLKRRLALLVPNTFTLAAVVCGLTAIRLSHDGSYALAMVAILGAVVLDVADGYAARRLKAESAMGAELDSLADFLNFGVAPAMLLYDRHLHEFGLAGWAIAAAYVLTTGLRLARFNIQARAQKAFLKEGHTDKPKWFCGLPSTAAALSMIALDTAVVSFFPAEANPVMAVATLTAAALMISTLPVPSLAAIFGRRR
ncbi:CDP-alcohol phosphatidyltransferase family protein [Rhodomicrobium vannielii ATCC 17100]|jgi:CDP-diacylglycerol--serine O-phosphatidyltransferase|uniref:CDP-alcohol phosphatidyltransferase family protein n=1 Tax=Rhodomicrobium vannielii TaxID=1069 RepID=UPI00191A45E8|nr:CDP-alcohol phosphatidyltransferase family protein [Rhodomicrobium vannielii]MBJ7535549.1 CDP-alcohol phosphatidyltransferase family protein [Rhodomicrobium vannielii ATCC 17100]